ncbi:MAG: helix-turn-helix domain-containing protein [Peptostreptococcaceae bacterium]
MEILSLGEKIKKLRKDKNMTLKELAGDRITAAQISHIERDKSHTSYELLEYLSEKLEVSADYLLETKEMQSKKITDNLILQIEIYIKCNQLEKAEDCIYESMKVCKEYELTESYGKCNFLLANINLKKDDYNEAVSNFEKALYFFIRNNDKDNIFRCYFEIGKIYMKEEFYKGAISHFNFAEEVLKEVQSEEINGCKDLYSKIAYCYIKLNQPDKSLDYIEKVDKLESKDKSSEEVDMLVLKANNLFKMNKYEEAKEIFRKALEVLAKEENKTVLADVYLSISEIYRSMGYNEKVLEYSHKVYDIKKNDEDKFMMDALFKIIEAYMENDDYDMARRYCKIALAMSIKYKNKFNEYKALKFYSDMYKKQNEDSLAIEYLTKCINIISALNETKILANLYIDLGQLYSHISKEKELEYYQKGVFMYKNLQII